MYHQGMKNKHHKNESIKKIIESNKGKHSKNGMFGKNHSKESNEKNRIAHEGIPRKNETKRKIRLARVKLIKDNYGICWPSYNKAACEYFRLFDEEHNTKGRYATYGGGEYEVKELGYWLDYINFEIKLIMEYDESHHYVNGELREKDKIRQEEIQALFQNFEFRRIKE